MRAILTYHSIDASGSPISCRPETFDRHVAWLRSGRVRVTTVDELLTLPASVDAVAITFDDGFVNFEEVAAPRLVDAGLPATVFVVSDLVGAGNTWDTHSGMPQLALMNWSSLIRLQERGVTIGAHTRTHRDLTQATPAVLDSEVRGCAEAIERHTGTKPTVFAYPYGRFDRASATLVSDVFECACTTEFRTLGSQVARESIPRLDMYYFQQPGRLETWGTPSFERYVAFRRGLRRVRRTVAATGMVR